MSWLDEVDIVRVISDFIPLRKQDDNWIGKCPWCSVEWLAVSPQLEIFYCFYCKAGGTADMFIDRLPKEYKTGMPQVVRDEIDKMNARRRKQNFRLVK